jgi:hypothetical protein
MRLNAAELNQLHSSTENEIGMVDQDLEAGDRHKLELMFLKEEFEAGIDELN